MSAYFRQNIVVFEVDEVMKYLSVILVGYFPEIYLKFLVSARMDTSILFGSCKDSG